VETTFSIGLAMGFLTGSGFFGMIDSFVFGWLLAGRASNAFRARQSSIYQINRQMTTQTPNIIGGSHPCA
jgi:hypothetical protein